MASILRIFAALCIVLGGIFFVPRAVIANCYNCTLSEYRECMAADFLHSSLRHGFLSAVGVSLFAAYLHRSIGTGILLLLVNMVLVIITVTVATATLHCNDVQAEYSGQIARGIAAVGSGLVLHSLMIVYGRIMPLWYRLTFASMYSMIITTSVLLFFFTPLIAQVREFRCSVLALLAAAVASCVGIKESWMSPRPLLDWELVSLPLAEMLLRAKCEDMAVPFPVARESVGSNIVVQARSSCAKNDAWRDRLLTIARETSSACAAGLVGGVDPSALFVVQITDPHLGSFMPPLQLRQLCNHVLRLDPDLIFLTGDFFTAEAHRDPDALFHSLEPLKKVANRVFACYGNHDVESPAVKQLVDDTMTRLGIRLLCDERAVVNTHLGNVEIIGLRYSPPLQRQQNIDAFFSNGSDGKLKEPSGVARLTCILLHDPGAFSCLPRNLGAIVFSGHTHGGHIGFYNRGFPHWTLGRLMGMHDNGAWCGRGNVLYVHRGQGARSLMTQAITRLGVPSEDSLLRISLTRR